jgi:hypothetical protein
MSTVVPTAEHPCALSASELGIRDPAEPLKDTKQDDEEQQQQRSQKHANAPSITHPKKGTLPICQVTGLGMSICIVLSGSSHRAGILCMGDTQTVGQAGCALLAVSFLGLHGRAGSFLDLHGRHAQPLISYVGQDMCQLWLQVDGCGMDLSAENFKGHHRRNRTCDEHMKSLCVVIDGQESRHCQQVCCGVVLHRPLMTM